MTPLLSEAETMAQFLSDRGLTPEYQKLMGCRWASCAEVMDASGFSADTIPERGAIAIPYAGVRGHDGQPYCRYRIVDQREDLDPDTETPRYLGPMGHPAEIYFPPNYQSHKNQLILYVIEGEIKAALLDSIGLRAVAIPGVYSWADAGARQIENEEGLDVTSKTKPHQALLDEALTAKEVVVVGDSDLAFNPKAKHGMRCLAQAMNRYVAEHRDSQAVAPHWNPITDARHTFVSLAIVPPEFNAEPTGEKDEFGEEITEFKIGKLGVDDYFMSQIKHMEEQKRQNATDSTTRLKAGQKVRAMLEALSIADISADDVTLGKLVAVECQDHLAAREKEWLVYRKNRGVWAVAKGNEFLKAPASIVDRIDAASSKIAVLYDEALGPYKNKAQSNRPGEIKDWWDEHKPIKEGMWLATKRLLSTPAQSLILAQTSHYAQVSKEYWDSHNELFACANGVLNLKTGRFVPHDPALLLTMRSDVNYDPLAECPKWLKFLAEVQPDLEVQRYLQTFFGYAATGDVKAQIIPFFVGRSLNGKGVLIKVLRKVFGAYQTVAPKSIVIKQKNGDPHPADLDSVRHVRWATLSEFSEDTHFDCGKLKNATGGDELTARGMGENFCAFDPHVVFTADTNAMPFIAEPTDSMKRRILIIEWAVSFKGRVDDDLADKLCEELPGILNWLVQGAMAYYRGGLKTIPRAIQKATDALWDSVDSVRQWIESECILDTAVKTNCKILGHSYADWCKDNLIPPCGNHKFNRRLRSSEIVIEKSNSRYLAIGIRLRNQAEQSFNGGEPPNEAPVETPPSKKPPVSTETDQPETKKPRRMIQ